MSSLEEQILKRGQSGQLVLSLCLDSRSARPGVVINDFVGLVLKLHFENCSSFNIKKICDMIY